MSPSPDRHGAELPGPDQDGNARALAVEQRLTVPVLVAALVSVPAVFLTTAGGTIAAVGSALNWASASVLIGESLVLLALSHERYRWIRTHQWKLLVAASVLPAVIFVVGPVQVLRLVLFVTALRVLRVRRILRAGNLLRRRIGLGDQRRDRLLLAGVAMVAVAFVVVVLVDPNSVSHRLVAWLLDRVRMW